MLAAWIAPVVLLMVVSACADGERSRNELSQQELDNIRSLGLLDSGEVILGLHSNAGGRDPVLNAGGFYTDRRVARYWIDKDPEESSTKSAWLAEVDTFIPHFNNPWPASSSIQVRTGPHSWFNLYVNGDANDVSTTTFYSGLLEEWTKAREPRTGNAETLH